MSDSEKKSAASEEQAPAKEAKSSSAQAVSQKGSSRPTGPLDEQAINAPDKQTLIMLSVLCLTTLIMWGAGRAACNYSVPGESLTPRSVTLKERTATPKGLGLELAQALAGGDFSTAEKLVRGEARAQVSEEKAACGSCEERKKRQGELLSVSTVVRANSLDSLVSVETTGAPEGKKTRLFRVEREERVWKATALLESAEGITLKTPPARSVVPSSLRRPRDHGEKSSMMSSAPAHRPGPMLKGKNPDDAPASPKEK